MAEKYAHPEYLVDTQWVADHLEDPAVRVVESDEDYLLYETGHIPGAVKVDWFTTLQHPVRRDFLSKEAFQELCSDLGISRDTTVVFYGDKSNWFATYAFWLFRYYGHEKLKIMNGGRAKWEQEDRPVTKEVPEYEKTTYKARQPDESVRAYREDVSSTSRPSNLWSMCALQKSIAASFYTCPAIRKKGQLAVDIFLGRPAFPGRKPQMKTGLLNLPGN
jgi:thiosulfate/3-mercaptopyruvate sulfurtransferase